MASVCIRASLVALALAACSQSGTGDRAASETDTVIVFSVDPGRTAGVFYAPELRSVLETARRAAEETGATGIATTHLMLGVLSTPANSGLTMLRTLEVDLAALEAGVRAIPLPRTPASPNRSLPYTAASREALKTAMHEAVELKHSEMTAADLLVGIIAGAKGPLAEVLTAHNVTLDAIRARARSGVGGA